MVISGVVHKFGGSSLANAERFRAAVQILKNEPGPIAAVVVAAPAGVSDQLNELICLKSSHRGVSNQRKKRYENSLLERQKQLAFDALSRADFSRVLASLIADFNETLAGDLSLEFNQAKALALGEMWSARILSALLEAEGTRNEIRDPSHWLVYNSVTQSLDFCQTQKHLIQVAQDSQAVAVVPGMLARDEHGNVVYFGDGGSDYCASLVAQALQATELQVWTDVNGIRSADPDFVRNTRLLPEMSYVQAERFAVHGAKVLHPKTMRPIAESQISLRVRNSFQPELKGTLVSQVSSVQQPLLGFTSLNELTLFCTKEQDAGPIEEALQKEKISATARGNSSGLKYYGLTRAELEAWHEFLDSCSASLGVPEILSEQALLLALLEDENFMTRIADTLDEVGVQSIPLQMADSKTVAFCLTRKNLKRAMVSLHDRLISRSQPIAVAVVGAGNVGRTFLAQLQEHILAKDSKSLLQIKAICNSQKMILHQNHVELAEWQHSLDHFGKETNLEELTAFMQNWGPQVIMVDATASERAANMHKKWLSLGFSVATANKLSCAGPLEGYRELRAAVSKNCLAQFRFETTVGAGLPIVETAQYLFETGDVLLGLEGVFSGSMSHLLNRMELGENFSVALKWIQANGFTEPDPWLDLSGLDVARKLVIIARQFEIPLNLSDVEVSPVVPQFLFEKYGRNWESYNSYFEELIKETHLKGEKLKFVGSLAVERRAFVRLKSYQKDHAFVSLKAGDNAVEYTTERYRNNPLVVCGPGAGAEVTAAGLCADVLKMIFTMRGHRRAEIVI